jgi:predicted phosphate transport protein (TIGR00153 family)
MSQLVRRVKDFFVPGEKDAFQRIEELARLGEEALQLLVKLFSHPRNGHKTENGNGSYPEIEEWVQRINILEKEGDKITQSIEEMLGRGAISASLSSEFTRLVDNVDSIIDRAHGLSRQLRRITRRPLREAKEFDDSFRKEQVRLIEIGLKQVHVFQRLLEIAATDRDQGFKLAADIERLEEEGDDVKDGMLDEIYGSWEKLDYAQFHNYLETTIEADDILDLCEDASDVVLAIMKALGA